jgi:hypothetical protein
MKADTVVDGDACGTSSRAGSARGSACAAALGGGEQPWCAGSEQPSYKEIAHKVAAAKSFPTLVPRLLKPAPTVESTRKSRPVARPRPGAERCSVPGGAATEQQRHATPDSQFNEEAARQRCVRKDTSGRQKTGKLAVYERRNHRMPARSFPRPDNAEPEPALRQEALAPDYASRPSHEGSVVACAAGGTRPPPLPPKNAKVTPPAPPGPLGARPPLKPSASEPSSVLLSLARPGALPRPVQRPLLLPSVGAKLDRWRNNEKPPSS